MVATSSSGKIYSVPVSRLPDLVYETKKDLLSHGLLAPIVGHVGDGNFHAQILFSDDSELEVAKEAVVRMVKRAIAMDGTCTVRPISCDVFVQLISDLLMIRVNMVSDWVKRNFWLRNWVLER